MIERRNQLGKMRMDAMLNTPPGGAQQKPPTLAFRYADLEPEAKVQALKKIGIEVGSQQGQEPGQQQGQPQQPPHAEAQQKLQQNLQPLTAPQGASQTASPSQT